MTTAYSSFFASGLLAPPASIYSRREYRSRNDDDSTMLDAPSGYKTGGRALSPAAPSSPMAVPDDCSINTDFVDTRRQYDRATTPTPRVSRSRAFSDASTISTDSEGMMSLSTRHPTSDFNPNVMIVGAGADVTPGAGNGGLNDVSPHSPSQPSTARKLRRRRSSLAGAVSPMSAIKSPSRSAGHALELQKHLMGSPLRSRSNSLSLAAAATDMMIGGVGNIFNPEQNTFLGRLRSGSISALRRKPLRRVSMQPPAPPPTAPLPDLPSLWDTPNSGKSTMDDPNVGMFRKNRDRSYSINTYDRIDEEMKEF